MGGYITIGDYAGDGISTETQLVAQIVAPKEDERPRERNIPEEGRTTLWLQVDRAGARLRR